MIVYFDSSVLVAYYTTEERSDEATSLIQGAELPVISDLCIAELNVVVRRKQRQGFLSDTAATAVFDLFDEHVRDFFVRIPLDQGHLEATREFPTRAPKLLRTLDALHLAAAVDAGGALATFDNRLAEVGRSLRIEVLS